MEKQGGEFVKTSTKRLIIVLAAIGMVVVSVGVSGTRGKPVNDTSHSEVERRPS
jgi:hypothetical protein